MKKRSWQAAVLAFCVIAHGTAAAEPTGSRCQPVVSQNYRPIHWANGVAVAAEVTSRAGRYQSFKKIVSVSASGDIRISYTDNSEVSPATMPLYRFVSAADLRGAAVYDQSFGGSEFRQGATALGPSGYILRKLKQDGSAEASIHSLTGDALLPGRFTLLETQAVYVPVIVDDEETQLPALHAVGSFKTLSGEFWFLDDPETPLTLMYHIASAPPDWQDVRVTEITVLDSPQRGVQKILTQGGCVELHDINFDFDKYSLRPDAEPVLKAIADALRKQPSWRLMIAGYTDDTGSEEHNRELSRQRADAVVQALVQRYGIAAARLTQTGFGSDRQVASNATRIGRALNRRVEVSRQSS